MEPRCFAFFLSESMFSSNLGRLLRAVELLEQYAHRSFHSIRIKDGDFAPLS